MSKILIADDEALVLRLLRRALEGAGYEVETVFNGQEAWDRITASPPRMLITDIDMPRMTGAQLCMRISAELPDREFPICVLTAKTELEHREWSRQIRDVTFMEKPVSVRRLLARMEERLTRVVEEQA